MPMHAFLEQAPGNSKVIKTKDTGTDQALVPASSHSPSYPTSQALPAAGGDREHPSHHFCGSPMDGSPGQPATHPAGQTASLPYATACPPTLRHLQQRPPLGCGEGRRGGAGINREALLAQGKTLHDMSSLLAETALMDVRMLAHPPDQLAMACVALARTAVRLPPWSPALGPPRPTLLLPCMEALALAHAFVLAQPELQALAHKFGRQLDYSGLHLASLIHSAQAQLQQGLSGQGWQD
ncbi:hypothetical protein V8C86DRAFT_2556846 [Haematococcus lacustris]